MIEKEVGEWFYSGVLRLRWWVSIEVWGVTGVGRWEEGCREVCNKSINFHFNFMQFYSNHTLALK